MTARADLTAALVRLAAEGERPACGMFGVAEHWTSDDAAERAVAARACAGCPALDPCGAVAVEERHAFGVWGGKDRTRRPHATKTKTKTKGAR